MANGSRAATTTKMMTVGLDLGDRYSYLCLLDPVPTAKCSKRAGCALRLKPSSGAFALVSAWVLRSRGGHPLALGEPIARRVRP